MKPKIDWDDHIATWEESGLSKAEYCRLNGISKFSFYQKTGIARNPAQNKFVALPFPGIPVSREAGRIPVFEFHVEIPFHFRFRINIKCGRSRP